MAGLAGEPTCLTIDLTEEIRLNTLAESLSKDAYTQTTINLEKSRTVWVATIFNILIDD